MPNNSTKHTIVYIEDGDWRHTLTPAFNNGFGDNVEVDDRGNFQQLFQELEKGDLATAYILDNEIVGEDKYGAEIAQIIHQKAKELGKQVLVITMLCSAPKQVKKKYGASLAEKDIPILNKHAHAALCGFYIGQCLQEGVMTFDSWLMKEGITLLESNAETQSVQSGIMLEMEMGEAGGFYLKPRSFISEHRKEITEYMRPRDIVTM
ncbi:MAG: hypothetical protein U9Q63_03440, partial [Patescibacteria group bacterium]|nr:hypothetical protein [Patescibacteria group bacterium]